MRDLVGGTGVAVGGTEVAVGGTVVACSILALVISLLEGLSLIDSFSIIETSSDFVSSSCKLLKFEDMVSSIDEQDNKDTKKIQEELKKSKGSTQVIPYNENRAVVFNSNLFHETDKYNFKVGYENRRINVTLLFGYRRNN